MSLLAFRPRSSFTPARFLEPGEVVDLLPKAMTTTIEHSDWASHLFGALGQIGKAIDELWVMEDWHKLGPSYARTLDVWHTRSERFFNTSNRNITPKNSKASA